MPRTPAAQALELTKGMHAALMETPFGMKSGLSIQVCASVGLSASPADGTQMHEIIGTADARMYAVKRHGRGHVRAELKAVRSSWFVVRGSWFVDRGSWSAGPPPAFFGCRYRA